MLLRTEHVSKQFNDIYALKDINFSIEAGEIHGLVGENGAGKSTLIKLLTGVYSLDEGTIYWDDKPVRITNPVESRAVGINVIHQDRVLISSFDGVENAYLGMEYPTKGGRIDWKLMERRTREVADRLGIDIDLSKTAAELSPPQRTCLEIVRAMMQDCRLLILDEPTASLTDKESELLFRIIGTLKEKGTAILYVTHRMDEIFRLTDRITVFKNGEMVKTVNTVDVDKDQLVGMMTDHWVGQSIEHHTQFGPVLLNAQHICSADGIVQDADLQVHQGEILGVFGLGGSGRTELLECIYGYRAMEKGTVTLNGQPLAKPSPSSSIDHGMVLICEDRRGKALIGGLSVKENIVLSSMKHFSRMGVVSEKAERKAVDQQISALNIRLAGMEQRAVELSGGNQQKVVFAQVLLTQPKVFLCDEPTQAVDVMTRSEIHKLLRQKANEGAAVVYVSSDLKELLEVADNIRIMSRGKTRQLLENRDLDSQKVLSCCYEE